MTFKWYFLKKGLECLGGVFAVCIGGNVKSNDLTGIKKFDSLNVGWYVGYVGSLDRL